MLDMLGGAKETRERQSLSTQKTRSPHFLHGQNGLLYGSYGVNDYRNIRFSLENRVLRARDMRVRVKSVS
jgi:hypothetical protein